MTDSDSAWDQKSAAAVCAQLVCGSAVSTRRTDDFPYRVVWWIESPCVQSASSLQECLREIGIDECHTGLEVICSGNTTHILNMTYSAHFQVYIFIWGGLQ